MTNAVSIGLTCINQSRAQRQSGIGFEVRRSSERERVIRNRMSNRQLGSMEKYTRRRGPAVKCIAQNGKSVFRSVNADLVGPSSQWFRLHPLRIRSDQDFAARRKADRAE